MSQIDTYRIARPSLGTTSRPEAGLARLRATEIPPARALAGLKETVPERSQTTSLEQPELESVLAISAPDLERLEGMSREQMFAQLVHIEHGLKTKVSTTQDPDMRLSLETGLQMIQETMRRMHLVHSGVAALVLK